MSGTCIETTSGLYFEYTEPRVEQIDLADIASALSHVCRFAGHVKRFYSVAEHACLVHDLVKEAGYPELALAALHHDSHEAYIGDVPTPLKRLMGEAYEELRERIDTVLAQWLGLEGPEAFSHPAIRAADEEALRCEASQLKKSRGTGEHWGHAEPTFHAPHLGVDPPRANAVFAACHRKAGGP